MKSNFPRQALIVITTMLSLTIEFPISEYVYSHYQVQGCNHIHTLGADRADTFDKVRKLPKEAGWRDAPLTLLDLAVSNLLNILNIY